MAALVRKGILGTKLGMTRIFLENGACVACTLVEAGPCTVVQRKSAAGEGYEAVQLGYRPQKESRVTQPQMGHFKKAGAGPFQVVRELRFLQGEPVPEVGAKVTCDAFQAGEFVDVIGTMKGRGFAGVVKRHGFATMKESHGAHFFVRHGGSIGSRKPQHTLRGTRMAGQYGNTRVTVQNLQVLRVDAERNLLYLKGAVPGPSKGLVLVRGAKKKRG
jgi:large subunit ribosomal protein L3